MFGYVASFVLCSLLEDDLVAWKKFQSIPRMFFLYFFLFSTFSVFLWRNLGYSLRKKWISREVAQRFLIVLTSFMKLHVRNTFYSYTSSCEILTYGKIYQNSRSKFVFSSTWIEIVGKEITNSQCSEEFGWLKIPKLSHSMFCVLNAEGSEWMKASTLNHLKYFHPALCVREELS